MKAVQQHKHIHHKKRTGHHQQRSKRFMHTYLPYLPMLLILLTGLFLSGYRPSPPGTLAYATNVSSGGLLSATNSQRAANGKAALTINSSLSQAAQAKANDMTAKNYWSHNTPSGQEPWVFIVNTGYSYLKAGENLAYGFATSTETVSGWMNSPTHKANMLDADFSEVGFGYANSSNFNNSGQETVVVAMYGKPQVLAATPASAPAAAAPAAEATPAAAKPTTPSPTSAPAAAAPTATSETKPESPPKTQDDTIVNTESTQPLDSAATSKPVSRIEALLGGNNTWALFAVAFTTGSVVAVMLLRHGIALRRLLRDSERFVLHHPLIDSTLIALVILGIILTRTVGFTL